MTALAMQPSLVMQRLRLDAIIEVDVAELDPESAIAFIQVCEQAMSLVQARQNAAIVAAAGAVPRELQYLASDQSRGITDVIREEIALALRWSFAHAQQRIDTARMLERSLPQTRTALHDGGLTLAHAAVIARIAETVPDDRREEYESRVLPTALGQSIARTRQQATRVADRLHAQDRAERRRAVCHREAGVWLCPEADGLATLIARMPVEQAVLTMTAIDALAADRNAAFACEPDAPVGVRRAAALAQLVSRVGDHASAHVVVDVVIDLEALLGLSDADAEIGGIEGASAEAVRRLIASDPDATLRKLVTDPTTGHLLAVGRNRYRVSNRLREFVELRDRRCRFPGCRRRARQCEIDHALPWDLAGPTSAENLGALCKRHHQLKTHARWAIAESDASGACHWVSPDGREYRHAAVPVLQSSA